MKICIFKRLASFCTVTAVLSSFMMTTAGAAFTPDEANNAIVPTSNQIYQLKDLGVEDGVTFKLTNKQPVQVEFPDGHMETFEYLAEDISSEMAARATSTSNRVSVSRKVDSILTGLAGTVQFTLWADATWANRAVTITDKGLKYSSTFADVTPESTSITVKSASGSNYAKVRTIGSIQFYYPLELGNYYEKTYDFELWLDPANSSTGYLHINA